MVGIRLHHAADSDIPDRQIPRKEEIAARHHSDMGMRDDYSRTSDSHIVQHRPYFKDLFEYRVLSRAVVALLILPFLPVSGSILIYRGKKDIITCTSVCGGDTS